MSAHARRLMSAQAPRRPMSRTPPPPSAPGIVHEVTLSRAGNLTCPVYSGALVLGTVDYSRLQVGFGAVGAWGHRGRRRSAPRAAVRRSRSRSPRRALLPGPPRTCSSAPLPSPCCVDQL